MLGWALAIAAAILLIAVNGAVGFLGSEDNPANAIFAGVIGVAIVGSIVARFRAAGMVRAMYCTAAVQALVGLVALAAGLGTQGWGGVYEVVLGTGLFTTLWLSSAWLFHRAARQRSHSAAAP
jgi:hypothetical protein